MISAAGVAEHAKVMVALVNEVAAVDADVTVVVVAVEMHVARLRIMSTSPTRTETSIPRNGSDLEACDLMSCNCAKVVAVVADVVTVIRTCTVPPIVQPTVSLRAITTPATTIRIQILTMSQLTNPLFRILPTEVLKTVAVLAAVRIITTTDIRTPVVRAKCEY
jgi:predicted nucleic acid-binding Zn ribbon protein